MLSLLFETTRWPHIPPFLTILQMEGVTTGSDAEGLWAVIRGGCSHVQAHAGTLTPTRTLAAGLGPTQKGPAQPRLKELALLYCTNLCPCTPCGAQASREAHSDMHPDPHTWTRAHAAATQPWDGSPGSSTGSQSRNQVCWELSAQMSSQETDLRLRPSPGAWPVLRPAARAESRGREGQTPPCPLPRPGSYSEGVTVGVRTRV